jgi:hypothetical protein
MWRKVAQKCGLFLKFSKNGPKLTITQKVTMLGAHGLVDFGIDDRKPSIA